MSVAQTLQCTYTRRRKRKTALLLVVSKLSMKTVFCIAYCEAAQNCYPVITLTEILVTEFSNKRVFDF